MSIFCYRIASTVYLVVNILRLLSAVTFFPQIFIVIDDLDSFEEFSLGILQSISQLRFVQCVSHD